MTQRKNKRFSIFYYAFFIALIVFVGSAIYFLSPSKLSSEEIVFVENFEKMLSESRNSDEVATSRNFMEKVLERKIAKENFNGLSNKCFDQVLEARRLRVEDIVSGMDVEVFSDDCKREVNKSTHSKYITEINSICSYAENSKKFAGYIIHDADPSDDISLEEHLSRVDSACRLGVIAYNTEVVEYLDENLKKIDSLSKYLFLKIKKSVDKEDWGADTKKFISKLPYLEDFLKNTNRTLFVTNALNEIHTNNKRVEDLIFEENPIYQSIMELAEDFGKRKFTRTK
jgi:hypothetical protein